MQPYYSKPFVYILACNFNWYSYRVRQFEISHLCNLQLMNKILCTFSLHDLLLIVHSVLTSVIVTRKTIEFSFICIPSKAK